MSSARGSALVRLLFHGHRLRKPNFSLPVLHGFKNYCHYAKEPHNAKYVSLNEQSLLLPGSERIRASKLTDDPYTFVTDVPNAPSIKTVYDVLEFGLKVSGDGDCIGSRLSTTGQYKWFKYSEVLSRSQHVGSAFVHLGVKPRNESYVGVFASNREEFFLSLYGCAGYSLILVPLYESLGLKSILFIIKQVQFPLVIVNDNRNALFIVQNAAEFPFLHSLVIMDEPNAELTLAAKEKKLTLLTFQEMEALGGRNRKNLVLPSPDDLFCIPYTSGTTGIPKGVMLTHKNMISCVGSLVEGYGKAGLFGGTIMSYLPPAHIYEIANEVASLYFARRIAFYRGDIKKLMDEVRSLKPTVLPLVPRLMNAIYTQTFESIKGNTVKTFLLNIALSQKEKLINRGVITNKSIWDKLVFKKFQEALGGNVHLIITTSAPISPEVMKFFRCASGCYIFEAYGQTEVLAATMTLPQECSGGYVGPPVPCNHIKLADVPEMNYFSKNDTGEVCFKGENVFKGYFKNPEATKESIIDGWHHSGDIGRWLPNGALKIIDRKKHLFKLSQGEYIAPEKVENAYSRCKQVLQIYVDGLSNQNYVVALVVPELKNLEQWLRSRGYKSENIAESLQIKEIRRDFLSELHKYGKLEDLNPLEQARNLAFILEPFSVENDLLTPTFKVKRNLARDRFNSVFLKLYEEEPLVKSLKS